MGLTAEEGLEMGTLDFGGSVCAIYQSRHRNDKLPLEPKFQFTWIQFLKCVRKGGFRWYRSPLPGRSI